MTLLHLIYPFCAFLKKYLFVFIGIYMLVVHLHYVIIVYNILVFLSFILLMCFVYVSFGVTSNNCVLLVFHFCYVLCLYAFFFIFLRYIYDVALYLYIPSLCNCTMVNLCVLIIIFTNMLGLYVILSLFVTCLYVFFFMYYWHFYLLLSLSI